MRANRRLARIAAGCFGVSLVAVVAGAQCTNPVQILNQTISSGSPSFTDANALRADAVVINGSASVTFIAGNCINAKPGFQATAGTAGTTFHAWVQTLPAAVSVLPASGSGLSQTFIWTASSPAGYGSLAEIYSRFGTSAYEGPNTCYIRYDRTSNLLYLADNGASAWTGGFAPGSAQTVENSQCKIFGSGATASGSGTQLAVTVPVEFKAAFAGTKNNYLFARDNIGQYSGWQQMGTWTVSGTQQYTLSSMIVPVGPPPGGSTSLNPAGGSYPSGTQVQVTATPATGYTFTGWSGDLSGTANPAWMTMSANKTVTANFTASSGTYQHTITSSPLGLTLTVDGVPCTTPCTRDWTSSSSHTIAGAFRQQVSGTTYYFAYLGGAGVQQNQASWSSGNLSFPVTAQGSATTLTAVISSNGLQALRDCLGSSASSNCVLAEGTHQVASTITVQRPNVTIRGESADRTRSRLQRSAGHIYEIMKVDVAPPAESISIQDLTFCGGSALSTPGNGCPAPTSTTCGTWQQAIHQNRMSGLSDPPGTWICTDLMISRADTQRRPGNPFSYTGPYSVTISNSAFEGSTGHAVAIYPNAPQEVNDVYITGSAINSAEVTGLLVGVNGEDYSDHRACDGNLNFKDDPAVHAPRNIRVEGNSGAVNGFRNNFTGALGINAARWFALRDNTFLNNYFGPQAGNIHGGTVFFDQCTDTVQIYGNTLTAPAYQWTDGLELWGRNTNVGLVGAPQNTISNYLPGGISLNSVHSSEVRNNTTSNNGGGYQQAGIQVFSREPHGPCAPVFRETHDVQMSGNTSQQLYGVALVDKEFSSNVINALMIEGSGAVRQDPYVTLIGAGSISPAPYLPQPEPDQLSPRALPVKPVQDLIAPIRPVPAKCAAPGNRREVFTFPASDVHPEMGAANILSLEAIFSIAGDDATGENGPDNGAQGCRFIFYPPDDVSACTTSTCGDLYLAADDGVFYWDSWSPVGTSGINLTNSYCKIRAGSTESGSGAVMQGKVLKLTLDVEFYSSTKKHIYLKTENRDHLYSNGGAWKYWGWWSPTP